MTPISAADSTIIAPKITGYVTNVFVKNNQSVTTPASC